MIWLKSIHVFSVIVLLTVTVLADPIPASKKTDVEKNRSNTRHDHSSSGIECQYTKGTWSQCNPSTNMKFRTLTLKKGQDETKCEKTKTIEKKCKKICKYEKGIWNKCNADNEMIRTDVLRNANESDPSCEKSKVVKKTCKNKADRNGKGQQKRKHKQQDQMNNGKTKAKQN